MSLADGSVIRYAYNWQNKLVARTKGPEVRTYLYGKGTQVMEEQIVRNRRCHGAQKNPAGCVPGGRFGEQFRRLGLALERSAGPLRRLPGRPSKRAGAVREAGRSGAWIGDR